MKLIEVRTYKLKPGSAERHGCVSRGTPARMGKRYGRSCLWPLGYEQESFYLIRAYDSRAQLEAQQGAFYSSDAWRQGPREPLIACLDDYLNTLLWLCDQSVEDLRFNNGLGKPPVA